MIKLHEIDELAKKLFEEGKEEAAYLIYSIKPWIYQANSTHLMTNSPDKHAVAAAAFKQIDGILLKMLEMFPEGETADKVRSFISHVEKRRGGKK